VVILASVVSAVVIRAIIINNMYIDSQMSMNQEGLLDKESTFGAVIALVNDTEPSINKVPSGFIYNPLYSGAPVAFEYQRH
jgi:hypothetical protein